MTSRKTTGNCSIAHRTASMLESLMSSDSGVAEVAGKNSQNAHMFGCEPFQQIRRSVRHRSFRKAASIFWQCRIARNLSRRRGSHLWRASGFTSKLAEPLTRARNSTQGKVRSCNSTQGKVRSCKEVFVGSWPPRWESSFSRPSRMLPNRRPDKRKRYS